ncbi:hypothetical protein [Paenibacillus yonginensis]|uniref:hypothetical protein n=1 Tax=Paenibacillus yonginensis TaxID=1462996 RepID=UPI001243B7BB|nr:hypothetical protein [Paenibacillus yonginensis]
MIRFLPPARSNSWFVWYLIYAGIVTIALALYRFGRLGDEFDAGLLGRFALLALAFSGIVHVCGWLGGRLIWLISTAGLVIGIYTMFRYASRDMSGWEDLASFMSFMLLTAGGFLIGLLAEGANWLYRYLHRPREE